MSWFFSVHWARIYKKQLLLPVFKLSGLPLQLLERNLKIRVGVPEQRPVRMGMIFYAAMPVWGIYFLYQSTAVLTFELRVDLRSRKMTCIPRLFICVMLVKRLWENSGALKGSACLHLHLPSFQHHIQWFHCRWQVCCMLWLFFPVCTTYCTFSCWGCVSREEL